MRPFLQTLPGRRLWRPGFLLTAVFASLCSGLVQAQVTIGTPPPAVSVVGAGHSAHWFNPERAGEGIALEILENDRALMYWFTYDEQGNQRWLLGTGELLTENGSTIAVFPTLIATRGGRFGPDFDPDEVELDEVGTATMAFSGCDQAVFSYLAFGQEETLPMTRLSRTMGVDCAEPIHGRVLFPVTEDARLSGSWFDPDRAGQGFSLQWLDRDAALLTWYTYDDQGNPRWMIGEGRREGDQIVFDSLQTSRGGRFGPGFDPDEVELLPWGEVAMTLDCDSGTMTWDSQQPEFGQGGLNLVRLTRLDKLGCERLMPALSDLYDIDLVTEVPIGTAGFPTSNRVVSMSDDGRVVLGTNGFQRILRWEAGESAFSELPRAARFTDPVMTPDGKTIYATLRKVDDEDPSNFDILHDWNAASGWQLIPDFPFDRTALRGIAASGTHIVGTGYENASDNSVAIWSWSSEEGLREIANEEDFDFAFGVRGGSDDGRTAVGFGTDFEGPPSFPRRDRAVRWVDGQAEFLRDAAGNSLLVASGTAANGQVIFGGGQLADVDPDLSLTQQAWLWTERFGAEFVGRLPQALDQSTYDAFFTASADGSLLAGDFPVERPGGRIGTRGFIWTRATGLESLSEILAEVGIDDSGWENVGVVDVSTDGLLWLVSMLRNNGSGSAVNNTYAAILKLTPRVQPFE